MAVDSLEIFIKKDSIVDLVHEKLQPTQNVTVIKDGTLRPSVFQNTNTGSFTTTHRRLDITIINREKGEVQLVEKAIPIDIHIQETYQPKFEKYYMHTTDMHRS